MSVPYYRTTTRAHIRRYEDGSFADEWTGFWFKDQRVLHYWSAKTEKGWIAPQNHVFFDGNHHYNLGEPITEKVTLSPAGLTLELQGAQDVVWELGFTPGAEVPVDGELVGEEFTTHIQGKKEFEVHKVWVRGNPITIKTSLGTYPKTRFALVGPQPLEDLAKKAVKTILTLARDKGWYAGLPWFYQYWGRDFLWSVPTLLSMGFQKTVKKLLLRFILNERDGEPPRLIREDGTVEYGAIDTAPLLLLALRSYIIRTGDRSILEFREEIEEIAYFLEDKYPNLIARSKGKDTWMDSREDRGAAIEVQALWYAAMKGIRDIGVVATDPSEIKKAFLENKEAFLIERSANIFVAGIYGLLRPSEVLDLAKEWKLISEWGIRCWSPLEIDYDPRGYHSGAIWGLTTNWGLITAMLAHDVATVGSLLQALARRAPYLDELWDGKTGEPIGADCQLWTATLALEAVVDYGIRKSLLPKDLRPAKALVWEKGTWKYVST